MTSGTETAIIIAAFNAEATLDRAIASALRQRETAEVCVVDDASTDATQTHARAWAARDRRVSVLVLPANSGPSGARNAAIAATTAPWIAILDADDYLLDGRLGALHARAADADFIADALIRTHEGGIPEQPTAPFAPQPLSFEQFVLGNMGALRGPLDLGFLKPIFRRAFISANGMRYRDSMRLGEDYYFYAEALTRGARFLVGGPAGYVSMERPGSLSKDHSEEDLRRLRNCDDDLRAIRPLAEPERRALARHWTSVDCRLQWRRLISAVKARNLGQALSAFHTPDAAIYLAARLGEQAWLRSVGRWVAIR
jgi:succinoglycan biosynthesis protein ExoU